MDRPASPRTAGVLVALALAALVVVATGVAAASAHPTSDSGGSAGGSFGALEGTDTPLIYPQQAPEDFDFVEFRIVVEADGTARWTFQYSVILENESAVADFEAFATEFNETETPFFENFRHQADGLAEEGTAATGREMAAETFQREAFVREELTDRNRGIVAVSFDWVGFAPVDGDRVVVGDVFEGGLYLADGQRLVVAPGDGLQFHPDEINPTPDAMTGSTLAESDSATWLATDGDRLFPDGQPRVVLVPVGTVPADDDPEDEPRDADDGVDDGPIDDGTDDDSGTEGGFPWLYVAGAILLLSLLVGVTWFRRGGGSSTVAGLGTRRSPGTGPSTQGPSIPDEELMSDEDRVLSLLQERGGRVKQVEIVNETDWSKSKVSMLLSDMEEEGQISKLRVGRENIVSLAGYEPGTDGPDTE